MKRVLLLSLIVFGLLPPFAPGQQPAVLKVHLIGVGEYESAKPLAELKCHL